MATNPYAIVKPNKGSVFTDVKRPYVPIFDPRLQYGSYQGSNMSNLAVGKGTEAFKVDGDGMWLGATRFADAPFSVDMNGNMRSVSSAVGAGNARVETVEGVQYHYDAAGVLRIMTKDGGTYYFDSLGRLVGVAGTFPEYI